jgi:predicted  nucleic acid-binding Zn-ribbon protein
MTPSELTIKEGLLKLAGLAEVEAKIFEIQARLQEIPQNLKAMEEKLAQAKAAFEEKKGAFEALEKSHLQKEGELADTREKTKTREARLFEIKTTKEYQAAVKEVAATKKQLTEGEAELLKTTASMEALQKELPPLEEDLGKLSENVLSEKSKIQGDLDSLEGELKEQKALKEKLLTEIDRPLVTRYEKLLLKLRPAMASVRSGTCEECNMHLPPQLYIEIQKYREVIHCPSCHRILFTKSEG